MKKQVNRSAKIIPFCPHVKNRQYYIDKIVDYTLTAVTSMAAVTAVLFFALL